MGENPEITSKDYLSLLFAGEEELKRKIEHVTVMEGPDIKQWLKGKGFFLLLAFTLCVKEKRLNAG
ncbi:MULTISPECIES: hypothetical protein [Enterocloster]|nr:MULTISPECIES: hypothetical protein [Enterocloster]MDU1140785.1 hypothetical protein [Enterocloster bolteae]RHM69760.1 hypothetical protein DWZ48_29605 [Hungatella hathewayi]